MNVNATRRPSSMRSTVVFAPRFVPDDQLVNDQELLLVFCWYQRSGTRFRFSTIGTLYPFFGNEKKSSFCSHISFGPVFTITTFGTSYRSTAFSLTYMSACLQCPGGEQPELAVAVMFSGCAALYLLVAVLLCRVCRPATAATSDILQLQFNVFLMFMQILNGISMPSVWTACRGCRTVGSLPAVQYLYIQYVHVCTIYVVCV